MILYNLTFVTDTNHRNLKRPRPKLRNNIHSLPYLKGRLDYFLDELFYDLPGYLVYSLRLRESVINCHPLVMDGIPASLSVSFVTRVSGHSGSWSCSLVDRILRR